MKAVSPTGVSQSSGYVKADTPAALDPTPTPTPTPTSTPEPEPELETDPADQAPTGLSAALAEGGGVALSWTAPVEDADSVTGYEILRAAGEGELATLASDTASTATTYTDATATEAGQTYAYQVKAIRGEDRSQASGQTQVQIPHDAVDRTSPRHGPPRRRTPTASPALRDVGWPPHGDRLHLTYSNAIGDKLWPNPRPS